MQHLLDYKVNNTKTEALPIHIPMWNVEALQKEALIPMEEDYISYLDISITLRCEDLFSHNFSTLVRDMKLKLKLR